MQQWLVIYNCQTQGLSNSISLLARDIYVEHYDIWQFHSAYEKCIENINKYDRIIIHPQVNKLYGNAFIATNTSIIPSIEFSGYHPDFAYVSSGEVAVTGPMHAYNSLMALACFKRGVDLKLAHELFTRRVFGEAGYLDMWPAAMASLVARYEQCDVDLSKTAHNWGHSSAFMHTIDHPKISAVYALAKAILNKFKEPILDSDFLPHDNLALHSSLPVYPPIAEAYGIPGNYQFKVPGQYKMIDLKQFLYYSYQTFSNFPIEDLQPDATAKSRFARICDVVTEFAK